MGSSSSIILPSYQLGTPPEDFTALASTDSAILFINETNTIEIRLFEGEIKQIPLNLQPTCCNMSYSNGWFLGFKTGQIMEFDSEFDIVMSYHLPGSIHAHESEVLALSEVDCGDIRLVSYGSDCFLRLWNKYGQLIDSFTLNIPSSFLSTCFSISDSAVWYVGEGGKTVFSYNYSTKKTSSISLTNSVSFLKPIAIGRAALVIYDDGSIVLISPTTHIAKFDFQAFSKAQELIPLNIEEQIGLITYAVKDEEGNCTMRALDEVTINIGKAPEKYITSPSFITIISDKIEVYKRGDVEALSMYQMPDLGLPWTNIAEFLMKE